MPPKPVPTHFLCIPLITSASRPQLVQSLASFRADAIPSYGIHEDAIRPVGTLHLTLGVFAFSKNDPEGRLDKAKELLQSLQPREMLASIKHKSPPPTNMPETEPPPSSFGKGKVPETGPPATVERPASISELEPLCITLRGLRSMQPPSKASVLYAPPIDQAGVVQAFCERLRSAFQEAQLMAEEDRPLLLHATIVNTIYVKGDKGGGNKYKKGGGGRKKGEKLTFDARDVLERYEDQVWMENIKVEKIAICRMGAVKTEVEGVEDAVYEVEAEIDF
ncbi:kinase A anchor protein [Diplogelasinospora grovesii]|uniref:Kinase A anchor protein n=1 Tax=Diplogelasinospora grovesii TaxID=303347 RepID=A0AAN6NIE5_9PEZI|nr:kinase A anchor protein [Diplogelasinospora grovesii]